MDKTHAEVEQLKLKIEYIEEEKEKLKEENQDIHLELIYAKFDAEAYKRENEYLKKLLNEENE
jgi:uncharacterized protein (UPF0335 family)